jgi:hypothetical protein
LNNPEFVKIGDKKYKINTDFRVAIECDRIANDSSIGEYEKALAVIFKLFGEDGLNDTDNHEKLLELGQKYLVCGKELEDNNETSKIDMDFKQDLDYIEASFMSDYRIDLKDIKMHWWTFFNLLNGLSNSEMGNCCVLNRIRNLRNFDLSTIKDDKQRNEIRKAQQQVALKINERKLTKEEENSVNEFYELVGLK